MQFVRPAAPTGVAAGTMAASAPAAIVAIRTRVAR